MDTKYTVIWPGHLWIGGTLLFLFGLMLGIGFGVIIG